MTIRSGGRPRDGRATQARPYDQDAYATETVPEFSEPVPRGRDGRRGTVAAAACRVCSSS